MATAKAIGPEPSLLISGIGLLTAWFQAQDVLIAPSAQQRGRCDTRVPRILAKSRCRAMSQPGAERRPRSLAGPSTLGSRRRVTPVTRVKRRRQSVLVALSLGIPTAYMAFFLGGPIVKAIGISFTNLALSGPQAAHAQFVGANNYSTLFTSSQFWEGLKASIEYLVGSAIIGQVVVGFILALFVERLGKLARTPMGGYG